MGIMSKVLVPVAAEDESELICKFLAGMGAVGTRGAVLASVVDPNGVEPHELAGELDIERERFSGLAAGAIEAGIPTEIRIAAGETGEEIARIAEADNVTGLVVGTHGRSAWAKLFAGSVSAELLTKVRLPMMLVRYELMENAADPAQLARDFTQSIVVACDFSTGSTVAVLALLGMELTRVGRVFLVHVLSPLLSGEELAEAEAGAVFQLKNEARMLQQAGVDAHVVIRQGDPTRELLSEIDDRRCSGVIMGARGRSTLQAAILGTKSGAVVETAPCPVIVIP